MPQKRTRPFPAGKLGFGVSARIDFDNPDALSEAFPGGNYGILPLDRESFRGSIRMTHLGDGISVRSASFSGSVVVRAEFVGPLPTVAFFLPCIAGEHAVFNGKNVNRRNIVISHGGLTPEFYWHGAHEVGAVTIMRDTLVEAWDTLSGMRAPESLSQSVMIAANPDHAGRINALHREAGVLLSLASAQQPQANLAPGLKLLREEMLTALITMLTAGREERDHRATSRQTTSMARIERYIDGHAHEIVGLRDLCGGVGMALRTVETIIRSRTGLSALDYLKRRRLAFVRKLILTPNATTTVANAALSFGFLHFGRFSAEYRKVYGELPSRTLARTFGKGID